MFQIRGKMLFHLTRDVIKKKKEIRKQILIPGAEYENERGCKLEPE
jgi:hypothetical protein